MNKGFKKALSLLIALLMIVSMMPVSAFAINLTCNIVGHKLEWVETKAPTCSVKGEEVQKCMRKGCDYIAEVVNTETLSHTIVEIAACEPSCNKEGNTAGAYCSVCGFVTVKSEAIPVVDHTPVHFSAKDSTCTETGYESGIKCGVCQVVISGGQEIPAKGHTVTNALAWSVKVPATCLTEGVKVAPCAVCGGEVTDVVPTTTHTYAEWTVTKAATCIAEGLEETHCVVCTEKAYRKIDRLPHKEVITEAKAPTCIEAGNTRGIVCSTCGTVIEKLEYISAFGHDYITDESNNKEADCVNDGYFYGECSRCGDIRDEVILAWGHDEAIYAPFSPATCVEDGKTTGTYCKVCNEIVREQVVIPAKGHDYEATWQTIVSPTCQSTGISVRTCKNCYDAISTRLPIIDHNDKDDDGRCDTCGYNEGEATCTCKCHKKGLASWLFKLKLLFQKPLKLNKRCNCGVTHY